MKPLKEIVLMMRPREKLIREGARCLSDEELVAILLGSGNRRRNVIELAKRVVRIVDQTPPGASLEALLGEHGIGAAKASTIEAALEFARRRIRPEGVKIRNPEDVLPLVSHLIDRKQEHFVCVSLNGAHEVIASRVVTVGLVNSCQVHPREVFADPLIDRACAIIVVHNHPSGELIPSESDRVFTSRLEDAAALLGIKLLDHVIFSKRGHMSMQEAGMLKNS